MNCSGKIKKARSAGGEDGDNMPIYKMKGKKDGLQRYRVRLNYKDALGANRQLERVAYGLDEAKTLEMELSNDVKKDNVHKNMTLRELYDEYAQVKKCELREITIASKEHNFYLHIFPSLQNVRLSKLNSVALQKWKSSLDEKELALGTKRLCYGILRALLNYALKMEYIEKNPLDKIDNFKNSALIKKDINYYTADEFKAFKEKAFEYAQGKELEEGNLYGWNYYVFFCIAFYTGLRKGEIYALRWSDLHNGYLNVKRSLLQRPKKEDFESAPKNKSSIRTLQIPAPLINVLDEHYIRSKRVRDSDDNYRICGGERPVRNTAVDTHNKRFSEAAGLKTIRIHDYRHSHASLLANEGINIQEIARRLGHAKIEMTWNTYSHLYPREEERAVAILNGIE